MQSYNTGPVHMYVGLVAAPPYDPWGAAPTPVYLGMAEAAPQPSFHPEFQPIYADATGKKPWDVVFLGEDAFVSADITVYNEAVFQQITRRPRWAKKLDGSAAAVNGTVIAGDMGTMLRTEGYMFSLWLHFPYYSKFGDLPKGYRFVSAYVKGPDNHVIGTQPNKRRIQFHCLGAYDQANSTGKIKLYDQDFDDIPAIPPPEADGYTAGSLAS